MSLEVTHSQNAPVEMTHSHIPIELARFLDATDNDTLPFLLLKFYFFIIINN
jgi:hypothetical protein